MQCKSVSLWDGVKSVNKSSAPISDTMGLVFDKSVVLPYLVAALSVAMVIVLPMTISNFNTLHAEGAELGQYETWKQGTIIVVLQTVGEC